jgi:focal adhesion kinase 1
LIHSFPNTLGSYWKFNEERYKCALGVGWSVSVELVIGPQCGISHVTEKAATPTKMADFLQVISIASFSADANLPTPEAEEKGIVQIKVEWNTEVRSEVAIRDRDIVTGYA